MECCTVTYAIQPHCHVRRFAVQKQQKSFCMTFHLVEKKKKLIKEERFV